MSDYPETPASVRARLKAIIQLCKTAKDGKRLTLPIRRKAACYLNDLRFQLLLPDGYQNDHVKLWRERETDIVWLERDAQRAAGYSITDVRNLYAAFRSGLINDPMVTA